jgi:hypothetical protein
VTKTKKLANLNHFLERLHLNELVAHAGILAPLFNGLGAGAPPDGTLLATKKSQAIQEKFFQLSQTKSVVIQLLMQAGRGVCFGLVGLGLGLSLGFGFGFLQGKTAEMGELLQLFEAAPLLNSAQVDKFSELEVTMLSFEELMPGFIEGANELREREPLRIADVGGIAGHRASWGEIG